MEEQEINKLKAKIIIGVVSIGGFEGWHGFFNYYVWCRSLLLTSNLK
jgi:hypothetical protein